MSKFCEIPFFTLNNYFDALDLNENRTSASVLKGIIAKSFWLTLYVKTSTQFEKVRFRPKETYRKGNIFSFLKHPDDYSPTANDIIYFRKDSTMHTWLKANSSTYKYYLNVNKEFVFFGVAYNSGLFGTLSGYGTTLPIYNIEYHGLKDYVQNILPQYNRTDNIMRYLGIAFDIVYNKVYKQLENVHTLLDPDEVDKDFLEYIANIFNMPIDTIDSTNELKFREFIKNIPFILKRKGSISSLYIIAKLFLEDTTNLFNVYEKWNDWNEKSIPMVPQMYDYLHTAHYNLIPTTGAGYYYYNQYTTLPTLTAAVSGSSVIFNNNSNLWTIEHSYLTDNLFIQNFDSNGKTIYPAYMDFNSSVINIGWGDEEVSGYTNITLPDYNHTQESGSDTWTVSHSLEKNVLVQFKDSNKKKIFPDTVTLDDGSLIATFSEPVSGSVMVSNINYAHTQSTLASTWTITHNLSTSNILLECYDLDFKKIIPDEIQIVSANYATVEFNTDTSGYVFIKKLTFDKTSAEGRYAKNDLVLNPHVKLEVDLTNEALNDSYIINQDRIDNLHKYWDYLRPVIRVFHYWLLLSPYTDFSNEWRKTYDSNQILSKYCSVKQPIETGVFVFGTNANLNNWKIYHDLTGSNFLVRFFNLDREMIVPNSITNYNDRIEAGFNSPVSGNAYVIQPDYSTQIVAPSGTWKISHGQGTKNVIIQIEDSDKNVIIPDTIVNTSDNLSTITFSEPVSGYALVVSGDYTHTQSSANSTWTINHNLKKTGILVEFLDLNHNVIIPNSLIINSNNTCTATFKFNVSGYAIVNGIGDTGPIYDIESITNYKVGNGSSSIFDPVANNDIENSIIIGTNHTIITETDYHYINIDINNNIEGNLTELGLFDVNDNIIFYSKFDPMYKKAEFNIRFWFRIERKSK